MNIVILFFNTDYGFFSSLKFIVSGSKSVLNIISGMIFVLT